MRILLTGGAGFIGSHLAGALLRRGDELLILDHFLPPSETARKEHHLREEGVLQGRLPVRIVRGDLRDAALLAQLLPEVDAVVHLAALAGVRDSLADPLLYESVNVHGTLVLLQAMREAGCRKLVFASSSSVYGARGGEGGFSEEEPADRPVSPYAATKRAGELFCYAAHAHWDLDVSCLRFFTVYGPRQRPTMAIARFIDLALHDRPLPVFGDGSSLRDYTYIDDIVRGLLASLDRLNGFEVINLGCGDPIRLEQLVEAIRVAVDRPIQVERLPEQAGDVPRTHADIGKARRLLGWEPQVGIQRGLAETVAWQRRQG